MALWDRAKRTDFHTLTQSVQSSRKTKRLVFRSLSQNTYVVKNRYRRSGGKDAISPKPLGDNYNIMKCNFTSVCSLLYDSGDDLCIIPLFVAAVLKLISEKSGAVSNYGSSSTVVKVRLMHCSYLYLQNVMHHNSYISCVAGKAAIK